jgi:hypothetical protein
VYDSAQIGSRKPRRLTVTLPEEHPMNPLRALAILLIVAGTLALIYGGFNYTRDTHAIDLGPLQVQVQEQTSNTASSASSKGSSTNTARHHATAPRWRRTSARSSRP